MRRSDAFAGFWSCRVHFWGRVDAGDVAKGVLSVLVFCKGFADSVLGLFGLLFLYLYLIFLISFILS